MKAVVMAGGTASRFGRKVEKGVLKVGGRPLLERALSALATPGIDETVVAVTRRTTETEDAAKALGVDTVTTSGNGYHEDTVELIGLMGRFVSLNVDVPFANTTHVASLLGGLGARSAAAVVPIDLSYVQPEPSSVLIGPDGRMMVWVGLNVVSDDDDTSLVVLEDGLLCVNVNDDQSLELADRLARERML